MWNFALLVWVIGSSLCNPIIQNSIPNQTIQYMTSYSYTILKTTFSSGKEYFIDVTSQPSWMTSSRYYKQKGSLLTSNPRSVFVDGDFAYVADLNWLRVIDISDPSNPHIRGSSSITEANNVFVNTSRDGKVYAYVADSTSGLRIVDVSIPTSPTNVKVFEDTYKCLDVFVRNDFAYLADYTVGIKILNISDPTNPVFLGSFDTVDARGIFIYENNAYVADGSGGLKIIDITDPSSPTQKGSLSFGTVSAEAIFVADDIAYLGCGYSGLKIIDVSNPSTPVTLSEYVSNVHSVFVNPETSTAYITDSSNGVRDIDVSNPQQPVLKGTYDASTSALDVFYSNDYVFLVEDYIGMKIVYFDDIQVSGTCSISGQNNVEVDAIDVDEDSVRETFWVDCVCEEGFQGSDCSERITIENSSGNLIQKKGFFFCGSGLSIALFLVLVLNF